MCLCTIASGLQWLHIHHSNLDNWNVNETVDCEKYRFFTVHQRQLCRKYRHLMPSITDGIKSGLSECQRQLKDHLWNCSISLQTSTARGRYRRSVFLDKPYSGTREAAFVHAIISAGVVNSITRDCFQGKLGSCGCDRTWAKRQRYQGNSNLSWGECSANVGYGTAISRMFVDAAERARRRDIRERRRYKVQMRNRRKSLRKRKRVRNEMFVNLRNNDVGRKVIADNMDHKCKCHGLSGSCTSKSCWRNLPNFYSVSQLLKKNFLNAVQVHVLRKDGRTVPKGKGKRKLRGDTDLIYLRATRPSCNNQGRICVANGNHNSDDGLIGCDKLCCGKGHTTVSKTVESPCRCKFSWCCEVTCDLCNTTVTQQVCN